MNIFINTLHSYKLVHEKAKDYITKERKKILKSGKNLTERDVIYAFFKYLGFRMHLDYLALHGEQMVVVEVYHFLNPIASYEMMDSMDNIYNKAFNAAFEYMEGWLQENKGKQISEVQSSGRLLTR